MNWNVGKLTMHYKISTYLTPSLSTAHLMRLGLLVNGFRLDFACISNARAFNEWDTTILLQNMLTHYYCSFYKTEYVETITN